MSSSGLENLPDEAHQPAEKKGMFAMLKPCSHPTETMSHMESNCDDRYVRCACGKRDGCPAFVTFFTYIHCAYSQPLVSLSDAEIGNPGLWEGAKEVSC